MSAQTPVINGQQIDDDKAAFDRVQAFLDTTSSGYKGWGSEFSGDDLKLVSASSSPVGKVVLEFQVKSRHTNGLHNLHGGCCATLFDWCTTLAIVPISGPEFWKYLGVSRTLNVTYLRPVPVGTVVLIENEVVHVGKRLATLKGVMKRKSDGAILTVCEHGKVNIDPEVKSTM